MFYKVNANLREETATEFRRKLIDGTIQSQKPDGQEIVNAMSRAVVTQSGDIEWSEVCYCQTPLHHERTTVFDSHFDNLTTEVVEGYQTHEGKPFMDYLEELEGAVNTQ